jgi:hypothetical protein
MIFRAQVFRSGSVSCLGGREREKNGTTAAMLGRVEDGTPFVPNLIFEGLFKSIAV